MNMDHTNNSPQAREFIQSPQDLKAQNRRYRRTGGVSRANRKHGFTPAFQDTRTGVVYPSRFANGQAAPIHVLHGLPSDLVAQYPPAGLVNKIRDTLVAGFICDSRFYTRAQAAQAVLIIEKNKTLLDEFKQWLTAQGLTQSTIRHHLSNIDFYINEYLLCNTITEAKDGAASVGIFLDSDMLRKKQSASPSQLRRYAGSLKKFYRFLHEKSLVDADSLADLKQTLKQTRPRHNATSIENIWYDYLSAWYRWWLV